jgi:hypothetical protein
VTPATERRSSSKARDFQDFALVERLGLQRRGGERVQLVAVRGKSRRVAGETESRYHAAVDVWGDRRSNGVLSISARGRSACLVLTLARTSAGRASPREGNDQSLDDMQGRRDCGLERVGRDC